MDWHHNFAVFALIVASVCVAPSASQNGWFQTCQNNINLSVGYTQEIYSTGYPTYGFDPQSSCSWTIQAPGEYQVQAVCQIDMMGTPGNCPSQRFYVNNEPGVVNLNTATYYCGQQSNLTIVSTGNRLALSYISSAGSGQVYCKLTPICDCGWSTQARIVGGQQAGATEFPPMAVIFAPGGSTAYCGATIVSSRWVLTAAHCLNDYAATSLQVGVGVWQMNIPSSFVRYAVVNSQIAFGFVSGGDYNDAALLQVAGRFQWSSRVAPACLPLFYPYYDFAGRRVQATGFGTNGLGGKLSSVLMKTDLTVLSNADCAPQVKSTMLIFSQMCTYAKGNDTCQNDSGGPVFYRSVSDQRLFHVGVVSFGEGCGGPVPGVNSRSTSFMNWVNQVAGPLCQRPIT